jgi:hypothetical protein
MVEDIAAAGYEVVTAHQPAPIEVMIDPSVAATSPSRVICAGVPTHDFCNVTDFAPRDTGDGGVTIRLEPITLNPEVVMLEIVHVDGTTLGARVFTRRTSELAGPWCESATTMHPNLRFAGTLTLSSADLMNPGDLHGEADLMLEGEPITILF